MRRHRAEARAPPAVVRRLVGTQQMIWHDGATIGALVDRAAAKDDTWGKMKGANVAGHRHRTIPAAHAFQYDATGTLHLDANAGKRQLHHMVDHTTQRMPRGSGMRITLRGKTHIRSGANGVPTMVQR